MRQKTVPVQNAYVLDSINLTEIREALIHLISDQTGRKLNPLYAVRYPRVTMYMQHDDAIALSGIVSGKFVYFPDGWVVGIAVSHNLQKNEILFI